MFSIRFRFSVQWHHALALVLFLLPWQTRLILRQITWGGGVWEYGTIGIYATEVLLWGTALWYAFACLWKTENNTPRMAHPARISNKTWLGLGLFVLWFIYQIFRAQFPWVEVQALLHIFEACILWYLITRAHTHARFLQWSFLAGLGVQALLALIQFFTQYALVSRLLGMTEHPAWAGGSAVIETVGGRWLRAYGGLPHPNILGGYMAVGALLVVMQLVRMPREKTIRDAFKVSAVLLFFILLVSGLIVSFSRSALLAFVLGLMIMSWQYLRATWRHARRVRDVLHTTSGRDRQNAARCVGIILLSCILAAGIFIAFVPDIFLTRASGQTRLEKQSISERLVSYQGAREVARRDGLWGTGLGNYTGALYALDSSRPGWEYQPVHNAVVLAFLEFGFAMSVVVLFFLFSFLSTEISVSDWGLIVPLVVLAMFDHYLWSLWSGLVLCAVVFALVKVKRTKTG